MNIHTFDTINSKQLDVTYDEEISQVQLRKKDVGWIVSFNKQDIRDNREAFYDLVSHTVKMLEDVSKEEKDEL